MSWWRRLEHDGDAAFFTGALVFLYLACPVTVLALQFIVIPYGKHGGGGRWGPTIPPTLAWVLMESPALWVTLLLYPRGRHASEPLALFTISLYLLHYAHRTLVYPFRLLLNKRSSPFPASVAANGFFVNLLNAYLQSRSASHFAPPPTDGAWAAARVAAGSALFFWGMAVNVRSDLVLVRLRGGGYKVPRGGWFELVACPNFMGEAAEWLGWAVVAWSPASLAFFLSTCSNLGPRARAHLRWYKEKFGEEFPDSRKAILPFIY